MAELLPFPQEEWLLPANERVRSWLFQEHCDDYISGNMLQSATVIEANGSCPLNGVAAGVVMHMCYHHDRDVMLGKSLHAANSYLAEYAAKVETLDERYAITFNEEKLPTIFTVLILNSGLVSFSVDRINDCGDFEGATVVYSSDDNSKELFVNTKIERRACSFCRLRGEQCACNDTLRRRCLALNEQVETYARNDDLAGLLMPTLLNASFKVDSVVQMPDSKGVLSPPENRMFSIDINLHVDGPLCQEVKTKFTQRMVLRSQRPSFRATMLFEKQQLPSPSSAEHMARSKMQVIGKAFQCSACDSSFGRNCDLQRHVRLVHRKERRFLCELCGRSFMQLSNVHEHVAAVHERRRDQVCETCGSGFPTRQKLLRHIAAVHSRERKALCMLCGKRYFQNTDLKRHMRSAHLIDRKGQSAAYVDEAKSQSMARSTTLYVNADGTVDPDYFTSAVSLLDGLPQASEVEAFSGDGTHSSHGLTSISSTSDTSSVSPSPTN